MILGPTYHTWHQARRWNIRRNNSFYTNIQVNITLYLQDYNSSTLSLRSTFNIRVGYDIWLDCMLDQWCWCWYVLPVTSHCHWLYWQEERAEDSRTLVTADQGLSSSVLCHRVLVLCCRDSDHDVFRGEGRGRHQVHQHPRVHVVGHPDHDQCWLWWPLPHHGPGQVDRIMLWSIRYQNSL